MHVYTVMVYLYSFIGAFKYRVTLTGERPSTGADTLKLGGVGKKLIQSSKASATDKHKIIISLFCSGSWFLGGRKPRTPPKSASAPDRRNRLHYKDEVQRGNLKYWIPVSLPSIM